MSSAMSSRQAFASLSTRSGRLRSRSNETAQRSRVRGATACSGALTVTVVSAETDLPRSSTTLQVTVIAPAAAPVVLSVAVAVFPVTVPAVVAYE